MKLETLKLIALLASFTPAAFAGEKPTTELRADQMFVVVQANKLNYYGRNGELTSREICRVILREGKFLTHSTETFDGLSSHTNLEDCSKRNYGLTKLISTAMLEKRYIRLEHLYGDHPPYAPIVSLGKLIEPSGATLEEQVFKLEGELQSCQQSLRTLQASTESAQRNIELK